jgi:outer membrane protein assembly factor BamB/predicted phosphodiesterase
MKKFLYFLAVLLTTTFFTSLYSQGNFRFIHITDTHIGTAAGEIALSSAVAEINSEPAAFVIHTGDITELGLEEEYEKYLKIVKNLKPKLFNTPGNHEVAWASSKEYFKEYLGPLYGRFNYNGVEFILLDSSLVGEQYGHFDKKQVEWLKDVLKTIDKDTPIFVFSHHPILLFGETQFVDNEYEVFKIFEKHNLKAWFLGHTHEYRRYNVNGVEFIITLSVIPRRGVGSGYRIADVKDNIVELYEKKINYTPEKSSPPIALKSSEREIKWILPLPKDITGKEIEKIDISELLPYTFSLSLQLSSTNTHLSEDATIAYYVDKPPTFVSHYNSAYNNFYITLSTEMISCPGEHVVKMKYTTPEGKNSILQINVSYLAEAVQWKFEADGIVRGKPCIVGDKIYFTSEGGSCYCVNISNGKLIWKKDIGSAILSGAVSKNEKIYLSAENGYIYALNRCNGEIIWKYKTSGPIKSSPVIDENRIYVGSGDTYLYCFEAESGKLLWKFKAGKIISSSPFILGKRLYFGSWDQYFRCLDKSNGQLLWEIKIGRSVYFAPARSSPTGVIIDTTTEEGLVYITTPENKIYAISTSTGGICWVSDAKSGYSTPLIVEDELYIGGYDGYLNCFDVQSGKKIWSSEIGESVFDSSPILYEDKIIIPTLNSKICIFDKRHGKKLGEYKFSNGYVLGNGNISNGVLFIGSSDNNLYAINLEKILTLKKWIEIKQKETLQY